MKSGIAMAHRHLEADHPDPDFPVIFGYTSDRTLGESFMQITAETYGMDDVRLCQVSGIIGTHLGTDSIGLAYVKKSITRSSSFFPFGKKLFRFISVTACH